MKIKLAAGAKAPTKNYSSDAGWDLRAVSWEIVYPTIRINNTPEGPVDWDYSGHTKVNTGVSIAIPGGFYGQIAEKSGLAERGIGVIGGVIDSSFRGEIQVMLTNRTNKKIDFRPGEKIAQLLILPVSLEELEVVDELDTTDRGFGGFNSTGSF